MTISTPDLIAHLVELREKATPGEWRVTRDAQHEGNRRITSDENPHIGKIYARSPSDDAGFANAAFIVALVNAFPALTARLAEESEREDRAHGETIDQRDAAEQALSQAYFLIIGQSPEWSSLFGHAEALEEIDDAQSSLRQGIKAAEALNTTLASRLKEAEEALLPFAELCESSFDDEPPPRSGSVHLLIQGDGELGELQMKDFWAARAALKEPAASITKPDVEQS